MFVYLKFKMYLLLLNAESVIKSFKIVVGRPIFRDVTNKIIIFYTQ